MHEEKEYKAILGSRMPKSGIFFFLFFRISRVPPISIPSSADSSHWSFYVYVCYEDGPRIGREPRPTSVGIGWLHLDSRIARKPPRIATESCRLRNTFCPLRRSSSIARCGQLRYLQTRRGVSMYVIIRERAHNAVQCLRSCDLGIFR